MKKIFVELFVMSLIAALAYFFLKPLFESDSKGSSVKVNDPIALLDKMNATEKYFAVKIDSLKQVNADLNQSIIKARSSLSAVKKENVSLRQSIDELLSVHYSETDTSVLLSNCDSLANALVDFKDLDQVKDSIYEVMVADLQSQLSVKESMISLKQDECDTIRGSLAAIAFQNQQLVTENINQAATIKKHKRGKRLLSGILVVVAGVFAISAIH